MACTKQTAQGRLVNRPSHLTQARMNSEKDEIPEKVKPTHNTSMKSTQKEPTQKKLRAVPTDVSMKKEKKKKGRDSVSSTVITTLTNTEMMTTTRATPPTTTTQTTVMIELTPNMCIIPPIQPATNTITAVTLQMSLQIQTVMNASQILEKNYIPLTPITDPTVQILSLKTCETETFEVLDINNINIDEDIPEIIRDSSKDISFERDERLIMFSRDKELEKPDENTLTAAQLQVAEQIRQKYGNKRPCPQLPKPVTSTIDHKS